MVYYLKIMNVNNSPPSKLSFPFVSKNITILKSYLTN